MRLQVKDKVKMTDASYSYMVCDGELNGSWDSVGCTQKEYEIVAMNCVLPTDKFRVYLKNVPDNDTIIRRLPDGATIFTSERFLSLIERPKRKGKKVVEGWVNLYAFRPRPFFYETHSTEEAADNAADLSGRAGKAYFIHHEYEVEE